LESDGIPAGQIRFDLTEPHLFEIGYTIAHEFRGKGLGTVILRTSTHQLEQDKALLKPFTVRGVVKQENIPSCKAFLSAGYEENNNLQSDRPTSLRYFYRNLL
jgi:predicted acetyltransferase